MKVDRSARLLLAVVTIALLLSSVAIAAGQTKPKRKSSTRTATTRLVPVGTNLKIRLEDTLSSKDSRVGDTFTATVIDPSRFDEARVHGHISSIQKSGKVKGRTRINLAFNSIELSDNRKGTLHGYVTRVYGDDAGRADNEGGVESSGRGKQTVKRAGIGAAAGGIIGGIA